jgi:hypothetical protein
MEIAAASVSWRQVVRERYVLAVDLGQSNDPTAIAVLHHQEHEQFNTVLRRRERAETFDVRHLARLPLGLSYVDVVSEVARLRLPLGLTAPCHLGLFERDTRQKTSPIALQVTLVPSPLRLPDDDE